MNAKKTLEFIIKKRNWHEGKIERRLAFEYKKLLLSDKLSYEKTCEILKLLGYEKIQEEIWEKKEKSP